MCSCDDEEEEAALFRTTTAHLEVSISSSAAALPELMKTVLKEGLSSAASDMMLIYCKMYSFSFNLRLSGVWTVAISFLLWCMVQL